MPITPCTSADCHSHFHCVKELKSLIQSLETALRLAQELCGAQGQEGCSGAKSPFPASPTTQRRSVTRELAAAKERVHALEKELGEIPNVTHRAQLEYGSIMESWDSKSESETEIDSDSSLHWVSTKLPTEFFAHAHSESLKEAQGLYPTTTGLPYLDDEYTQMWDRGTAVIAGYSMGRVQENEQQRL